MSKVGIPSYTVLNERTIKRKVENSKNDFLQGAITPTLLKFAMPILFALLLQAAYGAVDLWVVGQFATSADISAVATGSQVMFIITGSITGLSMGSTIVIARKFAKKDDIGAADALGSTLRIFMILAVVITLLVIPFATQIAIFTNAPSDAFSKLVNYVSICASGTIFITGYNVVSAIFRGFGNSKAPLLFVAIACVANIILDLFFVAGLNMDASGTALATVISQALSLSFSFLYMRKKGLPVKFHKDNLVRNKRIEKEILKIGMPLALQNFFASFSFLIITSLVNSLGLLASASVGVAEKIVLFMFLLPQSFMSAISTFTAQNIAVQQYHRAKQGMWNGFRIAVIVGSMMCYLGVSHGDFLAGLFSDSSEVIAGAALFLMATSIESLFKAAESCFSGYISGSGKTAFVMAQGLIATFLIRIPISYFVVNSNNPTLFKLGLSAAISAAFSLVACAGYYFMIQKKNEKCMG